MYSGVAEAAGIFASAFLFLLIGIDSKVCDSNMCD